MKLFVIGAGYVGLVTAACLADLGHRVICVDVDEEKIRALREGRMPIYEAGLKPIVVDNHAAGRLHFDVGIGPSVGDAEVVFLAVGTPSRADGRADLGQIRAALEALAPYLAPGAVVVGKSTVPVGTGDMAAELLRSLTGREIAVASNPEFLREGVAVQDFMAPDRIVVGVEEGRTATVMAEVYRPLIAHGAPFLVTRRRTSELIKYAANSFLATKLGFINEMADLCERVGADVTEVARGIGLDRRIGERFLNAGPGFGGSCFPKDALALINTANDHGLALPIVEDVIHANEMRKRNIGRKVLAALGGSVAGRTIAVLGLAFKPDTDDMREAPSIDIVRSLDYWGARIRAYDPAAMEQARKALTGTPVTYATDPYECASDADAAVIITEWDEFRSLDLVRLKASLREPNLIDFRNIVDPAASLRAGLHYTGVGR